MVALITRLLLALQAMIAFVTAFALVKNNYVFNPFLAGLTAIGLLLLFRLLITANNFYLSLHFGSETPHIFRIGLKQAVKLFCSEFKATIVTSSWLMPFYKVEKYISKYSTVLPVLLVHGYACNSGYWYPLSKKFRQASITHYGMDLEPIAGSIDEYVPAIARMVEKICRETGANKIIAIGHSMGGLAIRAYINTHGLDHIAKVISLGTPHRGTGIAQFGIGQNCKQMKWSAGKPDGMPSEWLCQLAEKEHEEIYRHFVSIYSHHDNIIAPQTSSYLTGAKNLEFQGIGHVAMALHPLIQDIVIDEIRSASLPQNTT